MSAPAVSDWIARLEDSGIIPGYRAVVNHALLDRPMTVVIGVRSEQSFEQRELAQTVLQIPEVEWSSSSLAVLICRCGCGFETKHI